MSKQTGYAALNGTRLYYEMAGTGDPIVFVHGFSLDHRMWDDQFEALADRYRVIRYDLRGFGLSDPVNDERYDHSADLGALLDFLGLPACHLVGLSLGGWIALNMAITNAKAVRTLILVDSVVLGMAWSEEYLSWVNPIWEKASQIGIEAAKQDWLASPFFQPAFEQPTVGERLVQIVTDYTGWHFKNADPGVWPQPLVIERLEEVQQPTLVVVGERDISDCRSIADILCQRIRSSHKITLPGVGHMANMEAPGIFNKLLLDFLDETRSGQGQEIVRAMQS